MDKKNQYVICCESENVGCDHIDTGIVCVATDEMVAIAEVDRLQSINDRLQEKLEAIRVKEREYVEENPFPISKDRKLRQEHIKKLNEFHNKLFKDVGVDTTCSYEPNKIYGYVEVETI